MEVVAAAPTNGGVPPFHDHDVREWSRIDSLTGVLERATLETDNWRTNTNRYNKVVDSRARRDADGSLQQQARRQLEVFQSQIPGGHLQVIKTHTISSSKWTNKSSAVNKPTTNDFEDLQLSINSLDLSSEKSKASVGRSVSRRPPSRQQRTGRFDDSSTFHINTPLWDIHRTAATNLHRVSRLCHQIHESAVKQAFGVPIIADNSNNSEDAEVEIVEIASSNHSQSESASSSDLRRNNSSSINGHSSLLRTKSTSSEDLPYLISKSDSRKSVEDLEDLEQLQNWRRSSKIRRSLQFPKNKPISLPVDSNVSVRKIREELEKGRRLNTALRNKSVDLEALDQILQSVSNSSSEKSIDSSIEDRFNKIEDNFDKIEDGFEKIEDNFGTKSKKRDSFVTVESLNEVKSRLRRTNSVSEQFLPKKEDEETDDGIVTEDTMPKPSKIRSYIYGMEMNGFGGSNSLESRSSLKSEDWYNRRKSYGFEKMNQDDSKSIFDNCIESSTDSGICQSSEIVVIPATRLDSDSDTEIRGNTTGNSTGNATRNAPGNVKKMANLFDSDTKLNSTTIKIPISKNNNIVNLFRDSDGIVEDPSNEAYFFGSDDRKTKKVEFCKTEVHFAADSGKVNIVETDEKPPPTNNFRRRRRNSGPTIFDPDFQKTGLPVLHFGDSSYEKTMFGIGDLDEDIYENLNPSLGVVTVNTNQNCSESEDNRKFSEDFDNIKGILKNKPLKPKPYVLGCLDSDEEIGNKWGVKLRHIPKDDLPVSAAPIWRSTVTLRNSYDNSRGYHSSNEEYNNSQLEFHNLLRNLRPVVNSKNLSDSDFPKEQRSDKETKGYSTKVNIGNGEATVIENDKHPTWPTRKDSASQLKSTASNCSRIRLTDNDSKLIYKPNSPLLTRKSPTPTKSFASSPILSRKLSSPIKKEFKTISDNKLQSKTSNMVLRQPKRSEMTYFGVKVSPGPEKKPVPQEKKTNNGMKSNNLSNNQPDLLLHDNIRTKPQVLRSSKPARFSNRASSPFGADAIYENLPIGGAAKKSFTESKYGAKREFDSSILDELTKAADQILEAVNEFHKEEAEPVKSQKPLETIAENRKSSKTNRKYSSNLKESKTKVNRTSSASSLESVRLRRKNSDEPDVFKRLSSSPKPSDQKLVQKKRSGDSASIKARRLQRASSREALLQSHGSSSEDLAVPIVEPPPVRKPRLKKVTKTAQFTMTNGLDIKKSPVSTLNDKYEKSRDKSKDKANDKARDKSRERIEKKDLVAATLPEIRHKTAVSTIKSTAEKNRKARERSGTANDGKKRTSSSHRRESSSKGSSSRGMDKENKALLKNSGAKETIHRISTANIKRCPRAETKT